MTDSNDKENASASGVASSDMLDGTEVWHPKYGLGIVSNPRLGDDEIPVCFGTQPNCYMECVEASELSII